MSKSRLIIPIMALLVALGIAASSPKNVQAQTNSKYPPIIQGLIDKFHLNTSEVDQVISDVRDKQRSENQQRIDDRLSQAVKDGKITEAQKTLIENKLKEWQNSKDNWLNLTPQERREQMEAHRDDMQTWAQKNKINLQDILGGFGKGRDSRGMGWHMFGR